jgi:hypothetical protein
MSSSGSEDFLLKMVSHRNGAMTKADVTLIVWLVGVARRMSRAADGVDASVDATVLLLVVLHPVEAFDGRAVALAGAVAAAVLGAVGRVAMVAAATVMANGADTMIPRLPKL